MNKLKVIPIIILIFGLALLTSGCPGAATTAGTTAVASTSGTTAVTNTSGTTAVTTSATTLMPTRKPAIYLYPEKQQQVHVTLAYTGRLTCTYPAYGDGWCVTASPDGTLINQSDGREYSYLYWEGLTDVRYDFSKGFVVAGADTAAFLQQNLAFLGLTPREYNEFIVFWLPQMQDNPYNLVTFQGDRYTDNARLTIEPQPDTLLRVFMVYKPLQRSIEIEEPILTRTDRTGFTVVEWGGTCVG